VRLPGFVAHRLPPNGGELSAKDQRTKLRAPSPSNTWRKTVRVQPSRNEQFFLIISLPKWRRLEDVLQIATPPVTACDPGGRACGNDCSCLVYGQRRPQRCGRDAGPCLWLAIKGDRWRYQLLIFRLPKLQKIRSKLAAVCTSASRTSLASWAFRKERFRIDARMAARRRSSRLICGVSRRF